MKTVLIIDGQGGRIGKLLIEGIKAARPDAELLAVGTNSIATTAMLKAGANRGATGENAVVVNCRQADVIAGPLGIVVADALMGEISPAMAVAVGQSRALKLLIPINLCDNVVVGAAERPIKELIALAVERVVAACA
ncbi:MAG: hypothetical protein BWY35_00591 [Firmicutes bacterium ADurb.Bin248]|jgi:hypothetical protein|nr:MAG: hypothetical protein BWY35_00591 [Firmicutes bacterium ADurb.Bin248]HOG02296.1 DUF3842 family protein [Clostridia bacterium]HPK16337.1 DUF3842 family protein [Clostridia bacterium]